ncbi:MAG TPA: UbiA-like polyprenyltransferase [Phycisphaerae bacterium]|nr:UbiA-like polyprenyltransferase [Phycisphaerae bacterium]
MTLASNPSPPAAAPRGQLATFLDLIKFAHSIFALPFALIATVWAFQAANLWPPSAGTWIRLALILACMVIARTWAMTFNRLVDRRFDAANPRTAKRPSVTGAVSIPFMRGTLAACLLLFLAATAAFYFLAGNIWPVALALPVLAWLASYSYTKRFTALCHFWLGISLGLAPLSAWIALAPPIRTPWDPAALTVLLLGLGVAFWVGGFDILYALQDEDFDRANHLRSIPAALGRKSALVISRFSHLIAALLFLSVGLAGHLHALYWTGFAAAAALLLIEQSLVSARDISKINIAFMTANGLIGLVFGGLAIADMCVWPRTF